MPWQVKIASKLVLSHIPVGYRFWRRLGLFQYGEMDRSAYAYQIFKKHFDRVDFPRKRGGFVALEIGPGDSLFSALMAHAFGASGSYLIDVGQFARNDLKPYRDMVSFLAEKGLLVTDLVGANSLEELLAACKTHYGRRGLASLRSIADESVDFIWSQAVCEHIRRGEFLDTMLELRRVMRSDGVCSHRVDLRDHLCGALNNLRFEERFWESGLMASAGFYTNRIQYSEMLSLFQQAGFDVRVVRVDRWDELPTPRAKLSPTFRHLPDVELCISAFDVVLRPV